MDKVTLATETELGPPSSELISAEFRKKRRRIAVVVLAIVVVGLGSLVVGAWITAQQAKAQASAKLGDLSQCLFGEPVVDAPSARFRRQQLAVMNLALPDRGLIDGKAWPERCGLIAQELLGAAKSAGLSRKEEKDLGYYPDVLAKALKQERGHLDDASEFLEQTWAEAKKAGLVVERSNAAGPPSPPATPMTIDDLAKVTPLTKGYFPFKAVQIEPHPSDEPYFLVQDPSVDPPAFLCKVSKAAVECQRVPENVGKSNQGLRLLGTAEAGAAPLLFAGNRGDAGIYRSDTGEKIEALYAYGGYTTKQGRAFVLGWDPVERKPVLVTQQRGEAAKRRFFEPEKLEVGNYFYDSQLAHGHLFVRGWTDANEMKFLDYALEESEKLRAPIHIPGMGRLGRGGNDDIPYITACRNQGSLVLRVKSGHGTELLFWRDGKWSGPIEGLGGEYSADLLCTPTGGVFTTSFSQIRCTSAKCDGTDLAEAEITHAGGLELKPGENLSRAAALGERVVWVWAAGQRGGVRVRVGYASDIAKAPEQVFFDNLFEGGKLGTTSTVSELALISGNERAVLLMATKVGVYTFRVAADGKVTPEAVVWR